MFNTTMPHALAEIIEFVVKIKTQIHPLVDIERGIIVAEII